MLRRLGFSAVAARTAHVLAWVPALWLACWPVYGSGTAAAVAPGESVVQSTRESSTLIEQNGLYVVLLLLLPILLTGLAAWGAGPSASGRLWRGALLWTTALAMLAACAVAILSIGVFYLPSTIALLCAAVAWTAGSSAGRSA